MHDIVNFLKSAVDTSEGAGILGCYIVRDGIIYARNMHLQAGVAMASKQPFNVPASELNRALDRMRDVDKLTIRSGEIEIRAGRMRATIQTNGIETMGMPPMPEELRDAPQGLAHALSLCIPFMGDMGYSKSIQMHTGSVGAVSAQRAIRVALPGLEMDEPIMMSKEVAEFIVGQGDPDEYAVEKRCLVLRWDDGRWVRGQLLNYDAPDDNIKRIFDAAGDEGPVAIDAAWREAYADAVALSANGGIALTNDAFLVKGEHSSAEVAHATPGLPPDHRTYWDAKLLDAVVAVADRWNPAAHPNPAAFFGPGLKGVIMGMSRFK